MLPGCDRLSSWSCCTRARVTAASWIGTAPTASRPSDRSRGAIDRSLRRLWPNHPRAATLVGVSPSRARAAVLRACVWCGCLGLGAATVPRTVVGRDADAWYVDDRDTALAMADAVAAYVEDGVTTDAFSTGSPRFDGEWVLGTHQMAAIGLAQVVIAHPELRDRYLPVVVIAVERLLDDHTYGFAKSAWGTGPWQSLDRDYGHGYLGYVGLALGMLRELDPQTRHAAIHDRLVDALVRRMAAHPLGIVETYPGEAYPCDLAAIVGAIAQHDRLTGPDRPAGGARAELVAHMANVYRTHWIDGASGYLVQAVAGDGSPRDAPRGSGTALAAFFWSFADPAMAQALDRALLDGGHASVFGFAAIHEYAAGVAGLGDIDSGPVVLGVSVSATGFALSAARRQGNRERFAALFRTAALFGAPVSRDDRTRMLAGGPLGNAILLAMLTARRP